MKKIIALFVSLALCFTLCTSASAYDTVRVIDDGDILTDLEQEQLEYIIDDISVRNNMDIVVLTANSLDGKSAWQYADDFYNENGYKSDGTIFLVSMEERDWYISNYGSGRYVMNESALDEVERSVISYLSDGYYYDAFELFAQMCDENASGTTVGGSDNVKDYVDLTYATVRMIDNGEIMEVFEVDWLEQLLDEVSVRHDMDVVVLTVGPLDGKSAWQYADDFYNENGYKSDGTIFLVSMEERDWYISNYGLGRYVMNDDVLDEVEDDIIPLLSDGDYYDAFEAFGKLCDESATRLANGETYEDYSNGSSWGFELIIAIAIGFVIAFIVTSVLKSQLKSVQSVGTASNYVKANSLNLTVVSDHFLYNTVSKTKIVKSSSSSGGSSSGRGGSFGGGSSGRGGKF